MSVLLRHLIALKFVSTMLVAILVHVMKAISLIVMEQHVMVSK